jgi:hypothetical protein
VALKTGCMWREQAGRRTCRCSSSRLHSPRSWTQRSSQPATPMRCCCRGEGEVARLGSWRPGRPSAHADPAGGESHLRSGSQAGLSTAARGRREEFSLPRLMLMHAKEQPTM